MKTPLLLISLLIFARLAFAAEFSKGDTVTLTRDEPLYFKDAVHRQGTKGETFTVHSHNADAHKVFVVTKDAKGQPIGLNINEDAFASALTPPAFPSPAGQNEPPPRPAPLPLIEPSEENVNYSEELKEAANQTGISEQGMKQIANFLEKGGMSFRETVFTLKQLDYMMGKASGGSADAEAILDMFDVKWDDIRAHSTYKSFALIAKHVAAEKDEDLELDRLGKLFTRSTSRQLLKAIRSSK